MMHTRVIPLLGAVALAIAGNAAAAAAEQTVRIGHVAPISGGIAHIGKDTENGVRMAIEQANARGLVIGGNKIKFELLAEDDAGDPRQATTVAQKLVDAKVNGVVGHLNSGTTIPASRIYNEAGIPQISPAATNPKYTQQGYSTAFRVVANDGQLGGALGRYAVDVLKASKIAVIDDRTAYGEGIATEFVKAAKKQSKNVSIVTQQFTNDKATDFNAILTAIKDKKPDLVFFGGLDAVAGPMLRQMKQLGINVKFVGGDGICTSEIVKLAGDALIDDQLICAEAGGVVDADKKGLDGFKLAFKKRFDAEVQIYAPYAFDAANAMIAAMQKANSVEPAKYLPQLAKIKYKGVTGPVAFDAKGDVKDGTLTLYTYKGGKRTLLTVTK